MTYGEIWWVDFGIPYGSEPGFRRPAVVVQNDILNQSKLNTCVVVPLSTNTELKQYQGNVFIGSVESGLPKDSVSLGALITSVDRSRFDVKAGKLTSNKVEQIVTAVEWVMENNQ